MIFRKGFCVTLDTLSEMSRNKNNHEDKEKEPGMWVLCPGKLNGISGCFPVDRAGTVKPCEPNMHKKVVVTFYFLELRLD